MWKFKKDIVQESINKSRNVIEYEKPNQDLYACDSYNYDNFKIKFTIQEKIKCLEEILNKLKKVLYVYEKSIEENSKYNYKIYCGGILLYVSSSNSIFEGELVNLIVNLNSIISNDFEKSQIKRLVFESKNEVESLLKKYNQENSENAYL